MTGRGQENRAGPKQQHQRQGCGSRSQSVARVQKWCSFHNTHLHSDAECYVQVAGRNQQIFGPQDRPTQQNFGPQGRATQQAGTSQQAGITSATTPNSRRRHTREHVAHTVGSGKAAPTDETVVQEYGGDMGFSLITKEKQEEKERDDSNHFSLLIDSGAFEHYLDSNLISGLNHILENYKLIENPVTL